MIDRSRRLTAQEFAEQKLDLPDGGRWVELIAGDLVRLEPPDDEHGTAVLNLSKALAEYVQNAQMGYACFELGLVVMEGPDTVLCPAVSYFIEGERFSLSDELITDKKPALVIEIASSTRRRELMRDRVGSYIDWGVAVVWVLDPVVKQVTIFERGKSSQHLGKNHDLSGDPVMPDFRMNVGKIFEIPDWWWH